jgi:cation:H+ antiporter
VLFAFSGIVIFLVAHEFAEALIDSGEQLGIDERLLVQWLAPLASEAPEFIITSLFAWRLLAAASLGALVSSKVNQWTLLVSTIPLVFNIASFWIGKDVPTTLQLDGTQRLDLLLTSAQSLFAVAIIANLTMNVREALLVFVLFMIQFLLSGFEGIDEMTQIVVTGIYFLLTLIMIVRDRTILQGMIQALRTTGNTAS